jgi:1,2-diacylglycerol 3-beta-galactosyltransferase
MKKILYLFSDTGGGHRASAKALIGAVEKLAPGQVKQEMVDVFSECSGFLNFFARLYAPVIKYVPQVWGVLYFFVDDIKRLMFLEKLAKPFIGNNLKKLIAERKPDMIVSVHPLMNHLTTGALKDLNLKIPMITVITDPLTIHRSWIDEQVDMAVVATEEAKQTALSFGMPERKLRVLGLPIRIDFAVEENEKTVRHPASVPFTVLMMGGGDGAGKMFDIAKAINNIGLKIQLDVICGRNKQLEDKLNDLARNTKFKMNVYGFTEKVADLMSSADLLITKAGPGSIAEALAMDLPMIIMSWIPGQEEGNVDFVKKDGLGKVSKDPKEIAAFVRELQTDNKELAVIKENIKRVRRPRASFDIAALILEHLGRTQ